MNHCYARTDAGREEIRYRRLKLSRPARNLLLIVDERRAGADWVQLVHGADPEDLQQLDQAGLIEARMPAAPVHQHQSVVKALAAMSYDQLYNLMTSQARERLGLVQGFTFVLEIERCTDRAELQELALRFLKLVQRRLGSDAARRLCAALAAVPLIEMAV